MRVTTTIDRGPVATTCPTPRNRWDSHKRWTKPWGPVTGLWLTQTLTGTPTSADNFYSLTNQFFGINQCQTATQFGSVLGPLLLTLPFGGEGAAETAPELASGLERTGTALSKSDPFHRSVSWVVDNPAAQRFAVKGGDGVSRELYQLPGEVNGKSGVFEWIIDRSGSNPVINHQRFIPGGSVTGFPNQVVP